MRWERKEPSMEVAVIGGGNTAIDCAREHGLNLPMLEP
jgi:NADPH-dependent glutamate synthase beta subunit-like oxidoreductase